MNYSLIFLLVAISIVLLLVTTHIWISQQGYPWLVPSYSSSIGESQQERVTEVTQLSRGQIVATTVNTLDLINEKCEAVSYESYLKTLKPTGNFWYNKNLNLYYCIAPKVGCTYWKRVLRFVSQDYPEERRQDIKTPSDIDRYFVHYGEHPRVSEFTMNDSIMLENINNRAFMFTRDPYTRLWSAYLDKLYLPDFFRMSKRLANGVRQNKTQTDPGCDKGLTFQEFLTSITKMWPKRLNEHWEPIHSLCNPCVVKYAAIGKMEHSTEDTKYILTEFGFNWENITSKGRFDYEEIRSLTEFTFTIVLHKHINCFSLMELAQRLWKTFQYNGYIDRYTEFPVAAFTEVNSTSHAIQTFLEVAKRTIDLQTEDISSQKRTMMLDVYRQIPTDLLDAIKNIYKYDFELFGYEKNVLK